MGKRLGSIFQIKLLRYFSNRTEFRHRKYNNDPCTVFAESPQQTQMDGAATQIKPRPQGQMCAATTTVTLELTVSEGAQVIRSLNSCS